MAKRLYKSNTNRVVSGVCGGIGEYFNIDPSLVRLGWIVFSILGGSGIIAYIIAAIIIPGGRRYMPHHQHDNWHGEHGGHDANGSSMHGNGPPR